MDCDIEKYKYLNDDDLEKSTSKPKHTVLNYRRVTYPRILFCLLVLFVIIFYQHFVCMFGFINCYITWPFFSPVHVKLNLLNLTNETVVPNYIPRRMHHILLGPLGSAPPESWLQARKSCISLHPNFEEHLYWTDDNSEQFLRKNYPWFLRTWVSYKTIVQKADALRYFLLHHYGGVFLDMDLFCLHSLNGLFTYLDGHISSNKHMFLAVKAFPVGISNGFMIATRHHPLLQRVIDNLEFYNKNFILPHATIVISAGPMFISIQMQLDRSLWSSILVLDGKENMIGGKTSTPIFRHLGSGSWHKADDMIFKNIPMNIQRQTQTFSISILMFFIFVIVISIGKNRGFIKAFIPRVT